MHRPNEPINRTSKKKKKERENKISLIFRSSLTLIFAFSVFIQYLCPKFPRCSQTKVKTIAIHYFQNNLLTTVEREILKKVALTKFYFSYFFFLFFYFETFFEFESNWNFFSSFLQICRVREKDIFSRSFYGLFLIMQKCKEKILLWILWNEINFLTEKSYIVKKKIIKNWIRKWSLKNFVNNWKNWYFKKLKIEKIIVTKLKKLS